MSVIALVVIGVLMGALLGAGNNYLLFLVVQKSMAIDKADPKRINKARILLYMSLFVRMFFIVLVFFIINKLLGKEILLSACGGLAVITLISPYKKFYKQGQGKK